VDVSAKRHSREAWVTVRDTGKGIPRQFHRQIFDKFRQVEAQSGGHRLSVGLGLPFCRLVVEAHGGSIWVESASGEGSAFTFTVPLREDR
jgi:two-component system sensor histidine kinase/response regulator